MVEFDDIVVKLPQDVLFQILLKLPTTTLLNLRRVSKSFASLISHPYFLLLHLSSACAGVLPSCSAARHLLYYESTDYTKIYFSFHSSDKFALCKKLETPFKSVNGYLRLVSCSGGIVCLFDTNYFTCFGIVILWNPFIGRYKILPCLQGFDRSSSGFSHMAVGFGYDHVNSDSKVVKIMYSCDPPVAFVYGLKTGSWRSISHDVPCFVTRNWSSNVFVNGVVHWLAYKRDVSNGQPDCILAFDVADESFKRMDFPSNLGRTGSRELRLSHSVDERSLVLLISYRGNVEWDVWLMEDYANADSWIIKYSIVLEEVFFPLEIVNDGEILAAMQGAELVLMNVETVEVTDLAVCGLPMSFHAAGYSPSLGLLDVGQALVKEVGSEGTIKGKVSEVFEMLENLSLLRSLPSPD